MSSKSLSFIRRRFAVAVKNTENTLRRERRLCTSRPRNAAATRGDDARRIRRLADATLTRCLRTIAEAEVDGINAQRCKILAEAEHEKRRNIAKKQHSNCLRTGAARRSRRSGQCICDAEPPGHDSQKSADAANFAKHHLRTSQDRTTAGKRRSTRARLHPSARRKISGGASSAAETSPQKWRRQDGRRPDHRTLGGRAQAAPRLQFPRACGLPCKYDLRRSGETHGRPDR